MRLVLDASLTLAWYFEDEATVETDRLLYAVTRGGAVDPPFWRLEVANGFQSAIRRKRIDQRYRDDSLADLRLPPIENRRRKRRARVVVDAPARGSIWTERL